MRVLTDARDADTCSRIRAAAGSGAGGEPYTFYQAGEFYFVTADAPRGSEFAPLLVARHDLALVAAFAL